MADPGVRTKSKSWEEGLTTRIFKTSMATWLKMNNNKNLRKLFGVWYRERQRVNACNVTPAPEASVPCPWKVLLPLSGPLLTSQWSPSLLGSRHHVKHGTGPRFIFTAVSALNTCYLALRKSSVNIICHWNEWLNQELVVNYCMKDMSKPLKKNTQKRPDIKPRDAAVTIKQN